MRKTVQNSIPISLLAQCIGYHIPHRSEYIRRTFRDPAFEFYFYSKARESSYVWIFPKSENITVGTGLRLGAKKIKKKFDDFLQSHPSAEKIQTDNIKRPHAHLLPAVNDPSFYDLPIAGDGWLLVGDAAGHVNPLTGEGISFAMFDGELAAQAILSKNLKEYENNWQESFGTTFKYGAKLQKLFYNPQFVHLLLKMAKRSEEMKRFIGDILEADIPYDLLFKKELMKRLPKIIFELLFK